MRLAYHIYLNREVLTCFQILMTDVIYLKSILGMSLVRTKHFSDFSLYFLAHLPVGTEYPDPNSEEVQLTLFTNNIARKFLSSFYLRFKEWHIVTWELSSHSHKFVYDENSKLVSLPFYLFIFLRFNSLITNCTNMSLTLTGLWLYQNIWLSCARAGMFFLWTKLHRHFELLESDLTQSKHS